MIVLHTKPFLHTGLPIQEYYELETCCIELNYNNMYQTCKFNKPVISNHTIKRAVPGHNSWFKGLAQRESVTPENIGSVKIWVYSLTKI